MRYFFDTEFIERGPHQPIDLISIGIVAEDGREYYAVSNEFHAEGADEWFSQNVFPYLEGDGYSGRRISLKEIGQGIEAFCSPQIYAAPEFWAYYADYDWVVFCQVFGRMIDLPKGFPKFCCDLKQLGVTCGNPDLPKQSNTKHNALHDARWNKLTYDFLSSVDATLRGWDTRR
jgi:hypothetical protein